MIFKCLFLCCCRESHLIVWVKLSLPGAVGNNTTMGAKASKKKGLSREDLDFLTANTNYSVETITAWYRGFREDCPDGKLTPDSFMQIYGNSFLTGNAKEFCDHVFRTFDRDKNGFIDFKEFLLAIHVTSSGTPEDKLNWAFRCEFFGTTKLSSVS